MSNLSEFRTRIAQVLADTSNAIWSEAWLDEGLRQALNEYSLVKPVQAVTTLTLAASGREVDVSSLTGLLAVSEVWLPYTASDPEHPPYVRNFKLWRDLGLLYFPDGDEPAAGDTARIFYSTAQSIEGLDSAAATSLPGEHEAILVGGAAGIVAASRALDLTEQVSISQLAAQQVRAWGLSKIQEFRTALRAVGKATAEGSAFVPLPDLDRFDGDWS